MWFVQAATVDLCKHGHRKEELF